MSEAKEKDYSIALKIGGFAVYMATKAEDAGAAISKARGTAPGAEVMFCLESSDMAKAAEALHDKADKARKKSDDDGEAAKKTSDEAAEGEQKKREAKQEKKAEQAKKDAEKKTGAAAGKKSDKAG